MMHAPSARTCTTTPFGAASRTSRSPTTAQTQRSTRPGGVQHDPNYVRYQGVNLANADIQTMYADNGSLTPYTTIVEGWASPDFRLTSFGGYYTNKDSVGVVVCSSGYVSGGVANCGPILHPLNWDCFGYSDTRRANYSHALGDSGATVYAFVWGSYNVPLMGNHTGDSGSICNNYGGGNGMALFHHYTPTRAALGFSGYYIG
jgi:hypothetical protein